SHPRLSAILSLSTVPHAPEYPRIASGMKKLCLLFSLPLLAASTVPNRYIVQLSTAPVAQQAHALHSRAADQHRARVRAEQAAVRTRIQQAQGKIRATLENIQNALIVDIPDAAAARLSSIPGVKKVYPVRTFHPMLDHALPLHRVPQ